MQRNNPEEQILNCFLWALPLNQDGSFGMPIISKPLYVQNT